MDPVKFKYKVCSSEQEWPYIGYFLNADLNPHSASDTPVDLHSFENVDSRRSSQRLLVADSKHVEFQEKNTAMIGDEKFLIGVLNKTTNNVTLHDAHFFYMKPSVRADKAVDKLTQRDLSNSSQLTAARTQLTEEFGGKIKKQALSTAARYRVDANALRPMMGIMQQSLDVNTAENEMSLKELEEEADKGRPIPPYNAKATVLEDCYPFEELISSAEIAMLQGLAKDFSSVTPAIINAYRDTTRYPNCIINALEKSIAVHPQLRKVKGSILLYCQYLYFLRGLLGKKGVPTNIYEAQTAELPEIIRTRLSTLFTEQRDHPTNTTSKIVSSTRQKDLLLSYLYVLLMVAEDFHPLDLTVIAKDLGEQLAKVEEHFRALGCTISGGGRKRKQDGEDALPRMAVLTLPLKFPHRRVIPK